MAAKILCVDDEADIVALLDAILRMAGYETLLASTAGEALALLRERPDLVILDINLPDFDGIECCRRLRRRDPHVAVLFITAATAARRAEAREAGGNGFIQKPFELDSLLAVVERLLNGGQEWRSGADQRRWQQPHHWPDRRRGERREHGARAVGASGPPRPAAGASGLAGGDGPVCRSRSG